MSVVAIQGVKGSYSEEAARRLTGSDVEIVECLDFVAAFGAIATGRADFAAIPVENKIVGEIEDSMRLLRTSKYRIFETLPLKVLHVLAGTPDAELNSIRTVRSHVEALKQCKKFLAANAQMSQVIGADTASSIQRIIEENDAENAAIGSRRAVEIYRARIIAENIADDRDNWTTFCLVGK